MTKVLIADDAGVMRKVLIRELMELGVPVENIVEAADGIEAIEAAKAAKYDLILMDWNMPMLLGIDAVVRIRDLGIKAPIVMVTTESEKANVVRAIQAGANNYLIKPFTKDDFRQKIHQFLSA